MYVWERAAVVRAVGTVNLCVYVIEQAVHDRVKIVFVNYTTKQKM
jgi:hypothetical protein